MYPQNTSNVNSIKKNEGVTSTEKYLGKLCEKTFLSLWSYPGVYRDEGKSGGKGHGKEICDLLVVFGEHILIFSDKHCKLKKSENIKLDWSRWFKRAIEKSAQQVWGAERWIKEYPSRIYIDRECMNPIPIDLPETEHAKFHLILVAHGISDRIAELFGGSGSLMIGSDIQGLNNHTRPFTVGDLDPNKTFVHVLDDHSLDTLMTARDTIFDFVEYLTRRESLLRNQRKIIAPGEEELLANYLTNINKNDKHDFVFPTKEHENPNLIMLAEGNWLEFQNNPQRKAQIKQDKISYMWDSMIEVFNHYALQGNQYYVTSGGLRDTEKILRFMASEPRFKRRYFSQVLSEMLETTPDDQRRLRVVIPLTKVDTHYIFLLFPVLQPPSISNDEYRSMRRAFLYASCMVAKLKNSDALDIVGIATETGLKIDSRSEDALYLNARHWDGELEKEAKELQEEFQILKTANYGEFHLREYPEIRLDKIPKNPRNKKCPCGSGKKYKKCHGA